MSLVLDASLALSWYFEEERTVVADAVLDQVAEDGAWVPSLWRLEVANGLQVALRHNRLDVTFRDKALAELNRMPITIDPDTDTHAWSATLRLAERFGLTLYDAAYLELAARRTWHSPASTSRYAPPPARCRSGCSECRTERLFSRPNCNAACRVPHAMHAPP